CSTSWRGGRSPGSRPSRPCRPSMRHVARTLRWGPSAAVTIIPIRTLGDPVLKIRARDVVEFDDALARLAGDMFETMYAAPGVGLAAPQVGLSIRFFVFDSGAGDLGAIANPVLSERSGEQ